MLIPVHGQAVLADMLKYLQGHWTHKSAELEKMGAKSGQVIMTAEIEATALSMHDLTALHRNYRTHFAQVNNK